MNPLTGVLYCADCGHKMYNKLGNTGRDNKPHNEYVCSSYRHYSRSCTCHYIRVEVIEKLILDAIRRVSRYVRKNEAKFVERVRKESALQQDAAVRESKRKLTQSQRRREEIGGLIKKLYEAYAAEKIPEKHFTELLAGYDAEQSALDSEIAELQAAVDAFNTATVNIDKFIELVKRHTEFTEFSAGLLNEFVERVIVHEAVKIDGVRTQELEIFFTFIGKFDVQKAIITGRGNNMYAPKANATRAEAATILRRFVELVIDEGTVRGWIQNDAGQWQYINTYGKAVTSNWLTSGENKYYFDDKGVMVFGKWFQISGKWYYFGASGKLATNTTIDGYEVGADGARQ